MTDRLRLHQIPTRRDNYVYVVEAQQETQSIGAVIDPSDAEPVEAFLKEHDIRLTEIWNTHHHGDHVGGNRGLMAATGARIRGPATESIPGIHYPQKGHDHFAFCGHRVEVIDLRGHTSGHIGYWLADGPWVFCGDTLFSLGCGRLFEGTPKDMWTSLMRIRALPDETRVCCAHEYTLSNAAFAEAVDGDNPALRKHIAEAKALRAQGLSTVPSRLGDEKAANPFLRADSFAKSGALGQYYDDPAEAFAILRKRKDTFVG